jgi:PPOX class probable F420-dependent enzyme
MARTLDDLPCAALGGQPGFAPGAIERFARGPRVAVLAYTRRDGRPGQVPIWYALRDGAFWMSTVTGSPKHRALERDPRVCLTIQDERAPYRALIAEGKADLAPLDLSNDPTAGMAVRYFGKLGAAAYEKLTAAEYARTGLTLIALRPDVLRGFDNRRLLGAGSRAFLWLREHLPAPLADLL